MKFVLGFIQSFYAGISGTNTNIDENPSIPIWYFQHMLHLKH